VDGFFEWMAVKGSKVKQPYAIAMKDRSPFGIAGVWENWRGPAVKAFSKGRAPLGWISSKQAHQKGGPLGYAAREDRTGGTVSYR
jgi:putative SOS response-associated peptidase YedK